MMRSLAESKSRCTNRKSIEVEFRRRMSFCLSHYLDQKCSPGCPCQTYPHVSISPLFLLSTAESPFKSKCAMLVLSYLDSKDISIFACVSHHWEVIVEKYLLKQENHKTKSIIPQDYKNIEDFKDIVRNLINDANSFCHPWHTCIVESSHNQSLAFGEKRINYFSSFEGRTFCSYNNFNIGSLWIQRLYERLGI